MYIIISVMLSSVVYNACCMTQSIFRSWLCCSKISKFLIMAITANKKFWTEFIDIYRHLPSLWNTKDENYNNRESRSLAWNKLVEKIQEVEPDANQDTVKRKINTFRSNFNREVRKIRHTQKEQKTEVYNPTLWYFDILSFLLNQGKYNTNGISIDGHYDEELTLMGLSNAKNEIIIENETMHSETFIQNEMRDNDQNRHYEKSALHLEFNSNSCDKLRKLEHKPLIGCTPAKEILQTESITPEQECATAAHNFTSDNFTNRLENTEKTAEPGKSTPVAGTLRSNFKRSKQGFKSLDRYSRYKPRNNFVPSMSTDEAAIYGQAWACGFRKLNPQQKIFAKKAIDEILILGQLQALKLNMVHINDNLFEENRDEG